MTKEDRRFARGELWQKLPILFNGFECRCADGKEPLFPSFTAHSQQTLVPIDVSSNQPAQFADAEAAGIDCLQHRDVALSLNASSFSALFLLVRDGNELGGGLQQIVDLFCRQKLRQPFSQFWQGQVFDRGRGEDCVANEELVKCSQGAETKLNCRPAQSLSSQKSQVVAKIISAQCIPLRGMVPSFLMPGLKFHQCLPIVALSINRGPAISGQVREEFTDPWVAGGGFCGNNSLFNRPHRASNYFVASASRGGNSKVTLPVSSITR